jgi:hypothetical protein
MLMVDCRLFMDRVPTVDYYIRSSLFCDVRVCVFMFCAFVDNFARKQV